jgi:hypothetical protein
MKRTTTMRLRILAAALALAAAGTASAQISVPASSNGTDLFFYAFDSSTGTSYVQDLGTSFSGFLPTSAAAGANFQDSISSNAAWTTYVNTTEADSVTLGLGSGSGYAVGTQNTVWAVVAGIAPGGTNATTFGLSTTMTNGSSPIAQSEGTVRGAITGPLSQFAGTLGTITTSATSGYFDANATSDNAEVSLGSTLNGNLKVADTNAIGTSATFNYFNGNVTGSHLPTTYANTFNFDGTNLTYGSVVAAVPEPSSYLMMLAGLLMVAGLVTRRRNSK